MEPLIPLCWRAHGFGWPVRSVHCPVRSVHYAVRSGHCPARSFRRSSSSFRRPARSFLPVAAFLIALLAGCTTTRFPEDPEDHRLFRELEAAGHEYYFNVRAGVSSRLLGILPESDARAAMDEIRRRWPDIDSLDRTDAITAYMNANGLGEVGNRIQATLQQNQANAPPEGVDERLEAAAVKQGMIDAAFELEAEE